MLHVYSVRRELEPAARGVLCETTSLPSRDDGGDS